MTPAREPQGLLGIFGILKSSTLKGVLLGGLLVAIAGGLIRPDIFGIHKEEPQRQSYQDPAYLTECHDAIIRFNAQMDEVQRRLSSIERRLDYRVPPVADNNWRPGSR